MNSKIFAPTDLTARWTITSFGEAADLKAFTAGTAIRRPLVIDIGSNSCKAVAFDLSTAPPTVLKEDDYLCGLAAGMKPDDVNPQLNRHGIEMLYTVALPSFRSMMRNHRPDAVLVICTEAVRAAYNNPKARDATESFLSNVARGLGVPLKSINVVSAKLEGMLAAKTALCADLKDVYGIMMGGGSSEFFQIKNREVYKDHCVTLRFGTRSLTGNRHSQAIIKGEFARVPWFSAQPCADTTAAHKTTLLCLLGGGFRFIGRLLAERLDRIDFSAETPFGGYTFVGNEVLKKALHILHGQTSEDLFKHSFGKCHVKDLPIIKVHGQNYVQTERALIEAEHFKKMVQKWDKRIGLRSDNMDVLIETILEAVERLEPSTVNFSPHNMREATLRHGGLAYT